MAVPDVVEDNIVAGGVIGAVFDGNAFADTAGGRDMLLLKMDSAGSGRWKNSLFLGAGILIHQKHDDFRKAMLGLGCQKAAETWWVSSYRNKLQPVKDAKRRNQCWSTVGECLTLRPWCPGNCAANPHFMIQFSGSNMFFLVLFAAVRLGNLLKLLFSFYSATSSKVKLF